MRTFISFPMHEFVNIKSNMIGIGVSLSCPIGNWGIDLTNFNAQILQKLEFDDNTLLLYHANRFYIEDLQQQFSSKCTWCEKWSFIKISQKEDDLWNLCEYPTIDINKLFFDVKNVEANDEASFRQKEMTYMNILEYIKSRFEVCQHCKAPIEYSSAAGKSICECDQDIINS